MRKLTGVQREIVYSVAAVGSVKSLFRLTSDLGLNYSHAYNMVKELASQGILEVNRPGRDLVITLGACDSDKG